MGRFLLNLIGLLLVVAVNSLANILPFNGQTTGEISNKLHVLFTPSGYVFSIWGVIYLLLFIWVLRQLPKGRRHLPLYQTTNGLFLLSCVLNILWIFSWHYEYFFLSVIIMLGLLCTLILMYMKLKSTYSSSLDIIPFSVYLGWISVATIANVSYYLVYVQWDGFGISDFSWTIIMLVVAAALASTFLVKERDPYYVLVFVWAFIGIGVKNQTEYPALSLFTYILSIVLFSLVSYFKVKNKDFSK